MKTTANRILLALVSGLMLGLAFPPIPTGITAAFAFVPFFVLFESVENYGTAFRYSYGIFFIFNLVALYWTGGFTHCKDYYMMIAGALLILVHPFFFFIPIAAWVFIRRRFGFKTALLIFPFLWVGFEYLHSLSEIGFPWLTLGNTQTYDLSIIQFASFTGVYGISFWLLWLNILAFILFAKLALKEWKPISLQSMVMVFTILVLYFLPKFYGTLVLNNSEQVGNSNIRVALIQPNIDSFEKWTGDSYLPLSLIQQQTNEIANQQIELVVWPETALPFYILHPNNQYFFELLKNQVDVLHINLLTGIPDIYYYSEGEVVPKSSKISVNGMRYDTYNSSLLIQPYTEGIQRYAKIVLVPFAERVPFSEALSFLNAMQWNFGLGGWAIGKDTTVFHFATREGRQIKFSNMICYESVYPGLVSAFVKKGAQFLTVITNDSWWGNTSGTYQHKQFAILRAVENHRWIAQCANGGISCFIDPYGRIREQTEMYTRSALIGTVDPQDKLTFYTRHGDWFAEVSLMLSALLLAAASGKKFYNYIRMREHNGIH